MATRQRHLGLCSPATPRTHLPVNASRKNVLRKPDAGNPHVRFDEGEGTRRSLALPLIPCVPLYSTGLKHGISGFRTELRIAHWPKKENGKRQSFDRLCKILTKYLSRAIGVSLGA